MDKLNIPIYRAETEKQNFSDEEFETDKSLIKVNKTFYIVGLVVSKCGQIESETEDIVYSTKKETLCIHFADMIDSESTKIFASLSEDGRGGDKFMKEVNFRLDLPKPHNGTYWLNCKCVLIYKNFSMRLKYSFKDEFSESMGESDGDITNRSGFVSFEHGLKVTGIKQ